MMFRAALLAVATVEGTDHAKGFIAGNLDLPVANMTWEMRKAAPSRLDWTETAGATTPVSNEGKCGSTWAFAAVEGIQSGFFMTTGVAAPVLSTQQVLSCATNNQGCGGGDVAEAFKYVVGVGGIDVEESYPYVDDVTESYVTSSCAQHNNVVQVTGYKYAVQPCRFGSCSHQDEVGMMAALAQFGPLSVCWNMAESGRYQDGVFTDSCSSSRSSMDHCGQLVGYDTTASTPYWKIKNQWGTEWGEGGFMRLQMGTNACGIANYAMYATAKMVEKATPEVV